MDIQKEKRQAYIYGLQHNFIDKQERREAIAGGVLLCVLFGLMVLATVLLNVK